MSLEGRFSGRRILVVEDEMIVAWVLEEMLTYLGCEVVGPVVRINRAIEMIETEVFDAASLDVNLNGEKSYPVADALIARHVPFFFSTGYNKDSILSGYRGIPILQKPYSPMMLTAVLAELLTPSSRTSDCA